MKRLCLVLLLSSCIERLPDPGSDEGPAVAIQCLEDSQCPADRPACVEQVCQPCASNAYCSSDAPVCHNNLCIECLENSDCPEGKAVCQEQQCIDCTEDAHCTGSNRVCIDETCVACRVDADCPLERALCINATCEWDPDGRAAWAHKDVVLPGATSLHGVELNTAIELQYLHRLEPKGWTLDPIEEQGQLEWARILSEEGDRIAIHRAGLIMIAPRADAPLLDTPNIEGLAAADPQLRADLRGFLGFKHLLKLVQDLNDTAALSTGNPLDLLNNAQHHLLLAQDKHVLVHDIVFGEPSSIAIALGGDVWAKLKRNAWGHRILTRPSNQQTATQHRTFVVDLAEPATLRVHPVIQEDLYVGLPGTSSGLTSGEILARCASVLNVSIDDSSVTLSPEGIAIPAGRHTIGLEASTASTPQCETNAGRIKGDVAPASWWRVSMESHAALRLIGWDQGNLTTSSYNQNRRPITITLLASGVTDSDRDGWPDASDLCPTIADDMKDADQDGIGDRCDGVMSTERISERVLAALDANNEELYRTDITDPQRFRLWTLPVARAGTFPHKEGSHGLASEQTLIIKPSLDEPLRVLDGSGESMVTMLDGERLTLQTVATDGRKLVVMGNQLLGTQGTYSTTFGKNWWDERLLRFEITGMRAGGIRFLKDFHMRARYGNFTVLPRASIAANFGDVPVMTLVTTQNMPPLHIARLPAALIPGFNGSCERDDQCRDGKCYLAICALGNQPNERCSRNQDVAGYCGPDADLGYCVKRYDQQRRVGPSSFRSCNHIRPACNNSNQCPETQSCHNGRCKTLCFNQSDCSVAERCVGAEVNALGEVGVCATFANDASCEVDEVCMAASDLVHDLPFQLHSMTYLPDAPNGGMINGAMAINLPEVSLQGGPQSQSYREFTWCLPQLTNSNANSLSEPESRATLRRLFDRRTPWKEIFVPGQFLSDVKIFQNLFGINHAPQQSCAPLHSPWQLQFHKQLTPVTLEIVDLNGDNVEEIRIGFNFSGSQQGQPTTWQCYNVFGERVPENCTP